MASIPLPPGQKETLRPSETQADRTKVREVERLLPVEDARARGLLEKVLSPSA